MKSKTEDTIANFAKTQAPEHAAICDKLRTEIDSALPQASSKIWHGSPVWFIGENPVVGFDVSSKGVNLLFWSGQLFGEPALQPMGKMKAAGVRYSAASAIDVKLLRPWLKKAGTTVWDYAGMAARKRTAAKAR
jgi:hypothetical protein